MDYKELFKKLSKNSQKIYCCIENNSFNESLDKIENIIKNNL
jgi:hypothetical protein